MTERNGVAGLRGGYDALDAREQYAGLEGFQLGNSHGVKQALMVKLTHQRRVAVVTQAAGMDARGHKVMAQGGIASDFSCSSIDCTAFIVTGLVLSFIFHQYSHPAQQCRIPVVAR